MLKSFSQTQNSTARLFLAKSLFDLDKKNFIITDNPQDISILKNFSETIFNEKPHEITTAWELFALSSVKSGIFFAHTDIFRTEWNLYHIEKSQSYRISRGDNTTSEEIIEKILSLGYEHNPHLDSEFSYKKEGGILSIIANDLDFLYQIEWFDTEIDAIIATKISTKERNFIDSHIFPTKNIKNFSENEKIEDILPINEQLICSIPEILENTKIHLFGCDFLNEKKFFEKISHIHFSEINLPESQNLGVKIPEIENINSLLETIKNNENLGIKNIIFTRNKKNIEKFLENNNLENIEVHEVNYRQLRSCIIGENKGFSVQNLAIFADDILGKIFVKNRRSGSVAKNLDLLISLSPGDFVVHRDHGIGKFFAIVKKTMWNLEREYLELHYAENDKLFVPITEIFRISKYLGSSDVILTRLGWKEWEKTLSKTDEELRLIAENILETNAKRQMAMGRAFGKFPKEEENFRKEFPYEYTADQYAGIMDVFADMEAETPMDRLLSGDVWFGKTEIAMNAAYKAFLSGMQVAVISPLVVLAMEHYESFIERMNHLGVRIELLSRMNTPKQTEKILEKMKNGEVDIIIGTHRLLSEDVKWKKLWLLIIDEEHKFGVMHKEKIKKIRAGIDILSLSATPIPRSLNLALSGLRKISLLSTPPKKKKPIETIITSWNENIVQNAIERELDRNGQVIIVHNRIAWIESLKNELEEILSESGNDPKIIITHGRMSGNEIEDRIHDFKKKKYNILLTTTIIENGVNFLSANTIIIIDPEDFWLASLHQLRGRVGRRGDQGYCFLAYRKTLLSPEEKERLITIANNNHLGAGFEIAMRDMEIRGAGDILGIKQSGKSKDVGLPLYFRMLEEKIAELKDEKSKKIFTKIELEISYILSDELFISELDKLNFFREIENIETLEELENTENELGNSHDENIKNLFLLLKSRLIFGDFGVEKISKNLNFYVFDFVKWNSIENLKKFLENFDTKKQMLVVTPEKVRIDAKIFKNPKDFLQKITEKKL